MTAVVCQCGGDMVAERVQLPDGRQRFSLTCEVCWDGIAEYSRPEEVRVMLRGEWVSVGTIRVPA